MRTVATENIRRNELARDLWDLYQRHRGEVTGRLVRLARSPDDRLCVLGAGNCNDLDLRELSASYREIHLVDLDAQALAAAVNRQGLAAHAGVQLHGGTDVTGVADELSLYQAAPLPNDAVHRLAGQALTATLPTLPGPFEVVASDCLLTQLIDAVKLTLGEEHPLFLEMVLAIRTRHLRMLVELLAPGGRCLLVTDVVSSETAPELAQVQDHQLAEAISGWVAQRNFFTGANPFVLHQFYRTDPVTCPLIAEVSLLHPWRWQYPTRTYAVCAIEFVRYTIPNPRHST